MSRANTELPREVAGLVICQEYSDKIYVTRVNYEMMIGITDYGDTYPATTEIAFPEDVKFRLIEALPPVSTVEVFDNGYRFSEYR